MDDEKPSTKHLVLKTKEIVPTEARARPGDGTAISVQLIHQQNRNAGEKASRRRRDGSLFPTPALDPEPDLPPVFKPKEIVPLDAPSYPGDEEAIRVPEILLGNRIAEERSGWGRIRHWRRRKSRGTRDFLAVAGLADLAIFAVMRIVPGPAVIVYGVSGAVFVTLMLGWIMFVAMDDY